MTYYAVIDTNVLVSAMLKGTSVRTLIDELSKRAVFLDRTETDELFDDPDDVVFYEITLTAATSTYAYLITGNKKHFPQKPFVVTPHEMLNIISQEQPL